MIVITRPLPRPKGIAPGERVVTLIGPLGIERIAHVRTAAEAAVVEAAWRRGEFKFWPGDRRTPAGADS